MEVVAATPGNNGGGGSVPPFHDHDVREWSRIDTITGALERARLETDSWTANTGNSFHKYGKVVDSRSRTDADGALQQRARRQLEVFHSQVPGGQLQVVKTRTVSSSRWTAKTSTHGAPFAKDFENLQLALNPLDLSSEKSKASVGRSVARRPPSRQPRSRDTASSIPQHPIRDPHLTAATNLHRVSRLCHQIHETAVRQAFGKRSPVPSISERQSGDGSVSGVEIHEIESSSSESKSFNGHTNLSRTKSTSNDDINDKDSSTKSIEDLEDLEQLQNWRRTSKVRRSLQFPKQRRDSNTKPPDLPENSGSVRKIREDLEKGRRLNTVLRNNTFDLEALDQILQSISSSSSVDKISLTDDNIDDQENEQLISKTKQKRDSFVTVESLQEVRGRLRRTSSSSRDIYKQKDEEADDGIVTEETKDSSETEKPTENGVDSYVYGMDENMNKKQHMVGTGSLESRSKLVNGSSNNRKEDWYNRRKSYGFEQVQGHEEQSNSISHRSKNIVESSTDSGICRSSEIVIVPAATKTNGHSNDYDNDVNDSDPESKYNGYNRDGISYGKVKKMTSIFNHDDKNPYYNKIAHDELNNAWNKRASFKESDWKNNDIKSTTITIPIIKNNNIVELSWNDEPEKDIKRHSIAVDEFKYVAKNAEIKPRRTSLALNDHFMKNGGTEDENGPNNRKGKKVEFCKTEVHFAAESGKVNIVETDEKPPPTQNFRRRRRNSGLLSNFGEDFNKNGLPVLHFGDEKPVFEDGGLENKNKEQTNTYDATQTRVPPVFGLVTINTTSTHTEYQQDDKKDVQENENIKGILKNKPIKPKPYHLGETVPFTNGNSDEDSTWGVRLRPVQKEELPVWKSTVTLHNSYSDNKDNKSVPYHKGTEPEFQKLLKNLRPTKRADYLSDSENRYSDSFSNIRIVPSLKDNRRSSWSVADKVKITEDVHSVENRGYSTKVNFGNGEATVVENDGQSSKEHHPTWPRAECLTKDNIEEVETRVDVNTVYNKDDISSRKINVSVKDSVSPVVLRGNAPIPLTDLKSTATTENLSSPSLVCRNSTSTKELSSEIHVSGIEGSNVPDKLRTRPLNENVVLRQPRKSEMTYFGVNFSPKPVKRVSQAVIKKDSRLSEKPDLLQHHKLSPSPMKAKRSPSPLHTKRSPTPQRAQHNYSPSRKTPPPIKTRTKKSSPNAVEDKSPIYENLKTKTREIKSSTTREFDSSILEELTKAADQILQAVNGYADDDRLSSDDETKKNNSRNDTLDTISETKTWKQERHTRTSKSNPPNTKIKVRRTSSTSSVESLPKDRRRISPVERKPITARVAPEKPKKKVSDSNSVKNSTKARRLQRASSREALLQSHGSSSEDLAANIEVPIRKPRLIKKTKTAQLTISNGLDIKKPTTINYANKKHDTVGGKTEDRVLNSLSEIRHKTAVSTIRSTSEKTSRDRLRQRNEEVRKKTPTRREISKVTSTSRTPDRCSKSATTNKEAVTTHRISTANIKKCHRSEGGTRH